MRSVFPSLQRLSRFGGSDSLIVWRHATVGPGSNTQKSPGVLSRAVTRNTPSIGIAACPRGNTWRVFTSTENWWMDGSVLCGAACVGYGRCGYIWDGLMWSGPPQRPAGMRRQGARGEVIGFGPGKTCEAEKRQGSWCLWDTPHKPVFFKVQLGFCVCWTLSAPSVTVVCVCLCVSYLIPACISHDLYRAETYFWDTCFCF